MKGGTTLRFTFHVRECLAEVECGVMLRYQKAQIKLHRYLGDLARNVVYLMF